MLQKEARSKTIDVIVLSATGVIGLIISICLAAFLPDLWLIAIVVAMFGCTAFILSAIESVHKTIIEKNNLQPDSK